MKRLKKAKINFDCVNCVNWKQHPEQCYACSLNPDYTNKWRGINSCGIVNSLNKVRKPKNKK